MTETLTELQNTSIEALSNLKTFLISPTTPKKIYISRENKKKPYFWHLIVFYVMTETLTELQNTSEEA